MFDIALVATALTDGTARTKRLNIGGVDVLTPYSGSVTRYGVDVESIDLVEAGPDAVSSLSFTINDPYVEVRFADDAVVEFWDITNDRPLFAGFIQGMKIIPTAVGRTIRVTCVGVEALLDWMLIPTDQVKFNTKGEPVALFKNGSSLISVIQSLIGNATGVGFALRSFASLTDSDGIFGSQAYPIASFGDFAELQEDLEVTAGSSLRSAIAEAISISNLSSGFLSVDFYGGVRFYGGSLSEETGIRTIIEHTDYLSLTVKNTSAGPNQPSTYSFDVDVTGVTRAVYILGGNVAGTGILSDGSGKPGPVAFLEDDTILTVKRRDRVGKLYLQQLSQTVRGEIGWTAFGNAAGNYRPGSNIFLGPDAQVLSEVVVFSILTIRKQFRLGGAEDWTISFGGAQPSMVRSLRRLTRKTRS